MERCENANECEKVVSLIRQKSNLIKKVEELENKLIDAGLMESPIK